LANLWRGKFSENLIGLDLIFVGLPRGLERKQNLTYFAVRRRERVSIIVRKCTMKELTEDHKSRWCAHRGWVRIKGTAAPEGGDGFRSCACTKNEDAGGKKRKAPALTRRTLAHKKERHDS